MEIDDGLTHSYSNPYSTSATTHIEGVMKSNAIDNILSQIMLKTFLNAKFCKKQQHLFNYNAPCCDFE